MKKIYTFARKQATLTALSLLLFSSTVFSQICGPVVEDFSNTGGTTAGFTGDFAYDAPDRRLIRRGVIATAIYSVTTPTYQLASSASFLGFGFKLDGTEHVARIEIVIMYVSTLNNQITTVFIDQFVPSYDASNTATICRVLATSDLPGFPPGGKYRFRLDFTSSTGTGQINQTVMLSAFRTNGVVALTPLPVTFVGFEAKKTSNGTLLTWKVGGEENVARYEAEKSDDGRNFTTVGITNKTGKDTYTYMDASLANTVYYRVKSVDNDGKYAYSTIARIVNGKSEIVLNAFPSPVQNQLTIQHPVSVGNGIITINTADGRIVKSIRTVTGTMQTYIDMGGLQSGMYMVRFDNGTGSAETLKVVKQ